MHKSGFAKFIAFCLAVITLAAGLPVNILAEIKAEGLAVTGHKGGLISAFSQNSEKSSSPLCFCNCSDNRLSTSVS